MTLARMRGLAEAGLLDPMDYQLAAVLAETGEADDRVLLAAALASHRLGRGDVCLPLAEVAGAPWVEPPPGDGDLEIPRAPPLDDWEAALKGSALVSDGAVPAPLVLDAGHRLYLGRYHDYERRVAQRLRSEAAAAPDVPDPEAVIRGLDLLFPPRGLPEPDGQRLAAALALLRPLCVISGGPGTGKTTTVLRILALLLLLRGRLRIALAAPTGKAAARLSGAIRAGKAALPLAPELLDAVPEEAQTLHRLLGMGGRGTPRHHRDNPLHCDLLVVDEASMVDLPMMARLLDALGPGARLILLGDKDQLASVEAGSVLGDICDSGGAHAYRPAQAERLTELAGFPVAGDPAEPPMADALALLERSYRFDAASGIGRLARAVNAGRPDEALACLREPGRGDLEWHPQRGPRELAVLVGLAADAYDDYLAAASVEQALARLDGFRVLCAVREGPFGVRALNLALEAELGRRGRIDPRQPFYRGRALMVTRNDYALRLFNGDVGLVWPDAEGTPKAWFPMPDGPLRGLALGRLPEHETVLAMTVHKSQGSEFDQVLLILPPESPGPVTRELVYTGITRARQRVIVAAGEDALRRAMADRCRRASGLRDRLYGSL